MSLSDKHFLVGVTGSIAAYKTCYLVRLLMKSGAQVQVVMTKSATEFVGTQTFETLSNQPVHLDMFPKARAHVPWHVELARWGDALVIAPATANIIGKIANGIADDLMSATAMSFDKKKVIAPAMNPRMYENPALQKNLETLKALGWQIIQPGVGKMAHPQEGEGKGRMAEPEDILHRLNNLWREKDFAGVRVLVTAGPTEELWDPVRVLTNPSTGKMGFAIAREACDRGADVTVIAGPHRISDPIDCRMIDVRTALEMAQVVRNEIDKCDVLIMSAAVADYRPKSTHEQKIKKQDSATTLELEPTEDILASLPPHDGKQIRVGFAVETENILSEAKRKLTEKHLDLIVANDTSSPGSGFGTDTNRAVIIDKDGGQEERLLESKHQLANRILDLIAERRKSA
jgi:phosphopantothenoylcysteine decarboxylase/phosphopantothenate--cysteine ligase